MRSTLGLAVRRQGSGATTDLDACCLDRGRVRSGTMSASVTRTSTLVEPGEPDACDSTPILLESASTHAAAPGRDDGALGGGLVPVRGGQAVLGRSGRWWRGRRRRRAGPRAPRRSRCRPPPGWSAGPGRAAGAGRSWGMPASSAAIGTAWVTTSSWCSRGSTAAKRPVVEPASSTMVEPAGGEQGERGRADPPPWPRCWPGRARPGRTRCTVTELDGTAPPCTRRTSPIRSRAERSRRTVSVVTANFVSQLGRPRAVPPG